VSLTACGTTVDLAPGALAPSGTTGGDGLGPPPGVVTTSPDATLLPSAAGLPTEAGRPAPTDSTTPTVTTPHGTSVNRNPVKIGVVYVNNDSGASSAGIDNGNSFTPRRVYEALVAAYNKRGGVASRRIQPVYVELKSSSTNLRADIEAACTRFTQDEHVAAVWGGTGIYSEALSDCLTKAHTPQLSGDFGLGDADSLRRAPYLVPATTLTEDDRVRLLLERLTAAGRLTAKDQLGVVIEGCPFDQRAYARTVAPTARRLGLTIAQTVESQCFEDIRDLGGQAASMQSAVLSFQTNRITKVLFVSGSVEANLLLYFALAAEAQGFHPGYALTSAAAPAVQEANTPKAQLANAVGLGWLPSTDSNLVRTPPPAARACLQDLRSQGVAPQGAVDRAYAYGACDLIRLYDDALQVTRGDTGVSAVLGAIAAAGTGFDGASSYGERTDFRAGRRTGPAQGRFFAWSRACGCFDYTGSPMSLTN
jgi:hypothetical protein